MADEEIISLDDPSLAEAQQYDPEADRDAFVPPPELDAQGNAIDYLLKLSLGENKFGKHAAYFKRDKNGNPMGILMVDIRVVQPNGPFDKFKLNSDYLNTYIDKRTNASGFTNMARLLGSPMPKGLGVQQQAEHLEPLIAAEPILPGRLLWDAPWCGNCEEEQASLKGERNYPEKKDDSGSVIGHLAKAECPSCGQDLIPKIVVKKWLEK